MDVEKATRDGRLRVFTAGQPIPSATPAPLPTQAGATAQPTAASNRHRGDPDPAADRDPAASGCIRGSGEWGGWTFRGRMCADEVVNPNNFLNGALIPAAAIVLGAGMRGRPALEFTG